MLRYLGIVLTDLGFLTLISYAYTHVHTCVCIATLPVEAGSKLGHTLVLWMHGANLSCMADYPDLLLSYRVVFKLVSAILVDDVGQFVPAGVQSWIYGTASTLFFFLPLYFVFLMSFSVPEFCVYSQYT
jgi:hypothetical protein